MEKTKKLFAAALMAVLLASIGGCILVDRHGYDGRGGSDNCRFHRCWDNDRHDHDWGRR